MKNKQANHKSSNISVKKLKIYQLLKSIYWVTRFFLLAMHDINDNPLRNTMKLDTIANFLCIWKRCSSFPNYSHSFYLPYAVLYKFCLSLQIQICHLYEGSYFIHINRPPPNHFCFSSLNTLQSFKVFPISEWSMIVMVHK